MEGNPYFTSFKSELNGESRWYLMEGQNITKQENNKIYFYNRL